MIKVKKKWNTGQNNKNYVTGRTTCKDVLWVCTEGCIPHPALGLMPQFLQQCEIWCLPYACCLISRCGYQQTEKEMPLNVTFCTVFNSTITQQTMNNKQPFCHFTMCLLHVFALTWPSSGRSQTKEHKNGTFC